MYALTLSPALYEQITDHCAASPQQEACGLLAGRGQRVERVLPITNVAANPATAYHMDEAELARVLPLLAQAGQDVLAVYHSHPDGSTRPSRIDIASWAFPDAAMMIVSPHTRRASAWRVQNEDVTPVEIMLGAQASPAVHPPSTFARAAIILSALLGGLAVLLIALALLPPAPPIP
ncbi:MAG: M67 family metallopeptidase [Pleurocapsa minor GSE-CHR-MK-17-07R]|nr:M67 family metallopeptidase [Pleurocapsa minor GSE-CHR-MK 17-07R]